MFMIKYFGLFKMSCKRHSQNWRELFQVRDAAAIAKSFPSHFFFRIVYELDKILYFSRAPVPLCVTPRCFSAFGTKHCLKFLGNADEISKVLQSTFCLRAPTFVCAIRLCQLNLDKFCCPSQHGYFSCTRTLP